MSQSPNVSIILPTYNRSKLLRRSIVSVLAQTYKNFELLVVDDASTDHTKDIVESFDDERIHYICHDTNLGGGAARNTGISKAKGNYISFQDSDDEWLPEKLERQLLVLNSGKGEGIVYSAYIRWASGHVSVHPPLDTDPLAGDISIKQLRTNLIGTPTLLVERTILEKVGGFDEALDRFQDWELIIRLSKVSRVLFIPEPLVLAHISPDSLTKNLEAQAKALEHILDKHAESYSVYPAIRAKHEKTIGHCYCMSGEIEKGRHAFLRSLTLVPFQVSVWMCMAISYVGKSSYKEIYRLITQVFKYGRG
jgi:glycosyltransferase involved in cell wall biosynthesis